MWSDWVGLVLLMPNALCEICERYLRFEAIAIWRMDIFKGLHLNRCVCGDWVEEGY